MALTQTGKLYTWGLASDGRLGTRKLIGAQTTDKNEHTCIPQQIQFTDESVDTIQAMGQIAYCQVHSIKNAGQPALYLWGKIPAGLNMETYSQVNVIPEEFHALKPYNFSSVSIQQDFAIGLSHAVVVIFELPGKENGNYGPANGGTEFEVLAIPNFDGGVMSTLDDMLVIIDKIKCQDVNIMDDFNVPWIALDQLVVPKVLKKKRKLPGMQTGSDGSEEEEEEDVREDDDEEEEEAEEPSESSKGSEDEDGSEKKSDEDNEDGTESSVQSKRKKT